MRMFALMILMSMLGCNPVQRISNHANAIRTEAQALEEHGQAIGDPVVVAGAERIDGLAAGIHDELPNVTNKVPAWLSTLQWWGIAVAVVAVAIVGFMMLTGRMNWRHGVTVILGCFVLFGAAAIVAGIQTAARLAG